jgi:hypothetical protein
MTTTRREFVAQLGAMAAFGSTVGDAAHSQRPGLGAKSPAPAPWYRRTLRWGQTNITEIDPPRYDIPWWREYWRRTRSRA